MPLPPKPPYSSKHQHAYHSTPHTPFNTGHFHYTPDQQVASIALSYLHHLNSAQNAPSELTRTIPSSLVPFRTIPHHSVLYNLSALTTLRLRRHRTGYHRRFSRIDHASPSAITRTTQACTHRHRISCRQPESHSKFRGSRLSQESQTGLLSPLPRRAARADRPRRRHRRNTLHTIHTSHHMQHNQTNMRRGRQAHRMAMGDAAAAAPPIPIRTADG